jgi:4-hydroxy-tetrahydrodipicolinate synthase
VSIRSASDLKGVFPALFTPLRRDDPKRLRNSIDYAKAAQMIDDLLAVGVQGIVPVGTTGQSATLSPEQHLDFIRFAVEHVAGRAEIIAGAGSNCTRESIEMIQRVLKIAEVPVLCVTGYYNNPPQDGILEHFRTLSRETGAKIVVYNVPGRTNSYIEPDTLIALAEDPNIIGLKQAVDFKPGGERRKDTLKVFESTRGKDFAVMSGEDDALVSLLEIGGSGIITASGNIPEAAALMLRVIRAAEGGDFYEARKLQSELDPFVSACFSRKNPVPLSFFFNSPVYQPLCSVESTHGGHELADRLRTFMREKAPSLLKYHQ